MPQNAAPAQVQGARNNPGRPNQGNRREQNEEGGAEEEDEFRLPADNAPIDVWKDAATEIQIEYSNQKKELAAKERIINKKDRELEQARAQGGRKRVRRRLPETLVDGKYVAAGHRCALMQMVWLADGILDIQPDPTYLPERRYNKRQPEMLLQGEQADILDAVLPVDLRSDLLKLEHFQYRFSHAHGEQRRNSASRVRRYGSLIFGCKQDMIACDSANRASNDRFRELLGFKPDGAKPQDRYPCLAPMLFKDQRGGANSTSRVFRSEYIFKTFSALAFGGSSLHTPKKTKVPGQPVLAKVLGIRSITPGAIALSATLARWCISPDETFIEEGNETAVSWIDDYREYKRLIITGLLKETKVLEEQPGLRRGPFLELISEWNMRFFPHFGEAEEEGRDSSDDNERPDIAQMLEEIDAFGGEEGI
ncbi:hypothetical protein FRC12_005002 [Ceratobasidium sp. 428]|nr:hypothetical protein FRC12_005002 [Ceratobasidium sp. 428]